MASTDLCKLFGSEVFYKKTRSKIVILNILFNGFLTNNYKKKNDK